jgi:hypothetical protein
MCSMEGPGTSTKKDTVKAALREVLTLLHHDGDFAAIAGVTDRALRWYGPD